MSCMWLQEAHDIVRAHGRIWCPFQGIIGTSLPKSPWSLLCTFSIVRLLLPDEGWTSCLIFNVGLDGTQTLMSAATPSRLR